MAHDTADLTFDIRAFPTSDLWHIALAGAAKPLCGRAGSEYVDTEEALWFGDGRFRWCHRCHNSAYRLDRQYGREDRDG